MPGRRLPGSLRQTVCHINDKENGVARLQRIVDLLHHAFVELSVRLVNPRGVDQYHLRSGMPSVALGLLLQRNFEHAMNPCARRLRLVRDDSKFLPK